MGENLCYISGRSNLYYDKTTKIVYMAQTAYLRDGKLSVEWDYRRHLPVIFTAITPYLGEHGCPCRYDNGEIVEIL